MSFAFLKSTPIRILFFIFIANFFYDDPSLYLYKRIIYSIFIYWAIYEIGNFYFKSTRLESYIPMKSFQNYYLPILIPFLIYLIIQDLRNPNLSWITLLNNPFAILSAGPIFLYLVGSNTEDKDFDLMLHLCIVICVAFVMVFALPFFGKVKYYQGYISAYAFVPFLFIAFTQKKYKALAIFFILFGLYFSHVSGYRIIALRIILFISLFVGLNMFKKIGIMKFAIIAFSIFFLYHFIVNLQDILYIFKDIIGVRDFDDDDTRGFLWDEVLTELKGSEFIVGRGFLGTYFSEYFLMLLTRYRDYGDHYERFTVEVGFLNLLLKGGFVWYILYIIPLVFSSLKGIFFHYEDKIVYYISIFILTELFLMYIENIPYFSFQFSLLFFLAGYAMRKMKINENLDHNTVVQPG